MKMQFEPPSTPPEPPSRIVGDRGGDEVYRYTPELTFAVNVALAARRPLLITGPSGCGKSSLARSIAKIKKWRYVEQVISSRTQAQDLLWRFDAVRRLSDGAAGSLDPKAYHKYIEPGVLWWAFQPKSAALRGFRKVVLPEMEMPVAPYPENGQTDPDMPAVVLIDEIDKADPDVPNALLVPIGSYIFRVDGVEAPIAADDRRPPLIVITSNGERDLPAAFRRRCVEFTIVPPDKQLLRSIALAHFGVSENLGAFCDAILARAANRADADDHSNPKGPCINTAQFLDAIRACFELNVKPAKELDKAVKILSVVWPAGGVGGAP